MPLVRKPQWLAASVATCAVNAELPRASWFADEVSNGAPQAAPRNGSEAGKLHTWRFGASTALADRGVGGHLSSSGVSSVGKAGAVSFFEESVAAGFSSFFGSSFFSTNSARPGAVEG